jgi:hypothetical protein
MLCVGAGIAERRSQRVPTRSVGTRVLSVVEPGNIATDSDYVGFQYVARTLMILPEGFNQTISLVGSKSLQGFPCTVTDRIAFRWG